VLARATDAITRWVDVGLERAMDTVNRAATGAEDG